jgi:cytochrome oxidase assembly protein ShyY1
MKLLHKKCIWTAISSGIFYNTVWAYNWQMERKIWKQDMVADRTAKLQAKPQLITLD